MAQPSSGITPAMVEAARLEAQLAAEKAARAEAEARSAKALAAARRADAQAEAAKDEARERVVTSRLTRYFRILAMTAGLLLSGGGVVDERNNWLPDADGSALVVVGAGSLVGAALGTSKKKKDEEDEDGN